MYYILVHTTKPITKGMCMYKTGGKEEKNRHINIW